MCTSKNPLSSLYNSLHAKIPHKPHHDSGDYNAKEEEATYEVKLEGATR